MCQIHKSKFVSSGAHDIYRLQLQDDLLIESAAKL